MIARGVPTEAEFAPSSISFSIFFCLPAEPTERLKEEEEILVGANFKENDTSLGTRAGKLG